MKDRSDDPWHLERTLLPQSYVSLLIIALLNLMIHTCWIYICVCVCVCIVIWLPPGWGARCSSVVRAFAHSAMGRRIDPSWSGPIELFLVLASLHDWCNKDRGMCYPLCGIVHIKVPLLLIGKCSPCGSSGIPLSLSDWSSTICITP